VRRGCRCRKVWLTRIDCCYAETGDAAAAAAEDGDAAAAEDDIDEDILRQDVTEALGWMISSDGQLVEHGAWQDPIK
jgi:hypothetical protein